MDLRNFAHGRVIPVENYCDQPYMVRTDDGAWLLTLTTGPGREGDPGQHVVTMRTFDRGETWQDVLELEPVDGPEASYSALFKAPSGRIYCFYNHNTDNVRDLIVDDEHRLVHRRLDIIGHFVFRFSDDHGRTWSAERHDIPMRSFDIDRSKPMGDEVLFFWNVGHPFVRDGSFYITLHKVGHQPGDKSRSFMKRSEGAFLVSDNLLTERDPERIEWQTLPDGDFGLRAPEDAGPVAEEQNGVPLDDGSLYCVYRTTCGYLAAATSRDGGHTWEDRQYARYASDGRRIKNPRACPAMWKTGAGRYLLWFHNNSTLTVNDGLGAGSRNLVWLSAGREEGGSVLWSEPEIGVYVDGQARGVSYPDLIEEDGRWYFSGTQKSEARICEIDRGLLATIYGQAEERAVVAEGLVVDLQGEDCRPGSESPAPALPALSGTIRGQELPLEGRGGLSLDVRLKLEETSAGQIVLDTRGPGGTGYALKTGDFGSLVFEMCDGFNHACWEIDRDRIAAGSEHAVSLLVDGGAKVILCVVDGVLCDGGETRDFGYGRFNDMFKDISGGPALRLGAGLKGRLHRVRVYDRCLRVGEAIGNQRADGTGLRLGTGLAASHS